jgi:hypothetical protein
MNTQILNMLLCVFDISIYFLAQIFWAKKIISRWHSFLKRQYFVTNSLSNCQIVTENWFFGGRVSPHSPLLLSIHLWVLWKRVARKVEICLGMLTILATSGNWGEKKTLVKNGKTLFYLKSVPPTEFVGILLSFLFKMFSIFFVRCYQPLLETICKVTL